MRKRVLTCMFSLLAAAAAAAAIGAVASTGAGAIEESPAAARSAAAPSFGGAPSAARTPIRHLVVIFQENVSFDHYFGTYPHAANSDGQSFHAAKGTPVVDGLLPANSATLPPGLRHKSNLLVKNPNANLPQRLDASATGLGEDAGGQLTCDQDHNYSSEQQAFDGGAMDRFVQSVGQGSGTSPFGTPCSAAQVMDYYDGNTVTGLWNYAQHFAMSDYSFGTTFGPSAPGADGPNVVPNELSLIAKCWA